MAALTALIAATLLSVQGCDPGTPAQAAAPGQVVITATQARAVYQTYLQVSDNAAAAGAMSAGLGVVTNAAWETAHAQYVSMQAAGIPVQRYVYGTPRFYLPRLDGYPHWFMVAVPRHPAGNATFVTTLMVFSQFTAGGKWTLNGAAALAPGQSLPDIPRDSAGYVTAMSGDENTVLVSPDTTGAAQAAVVDEGPASAAAALANAGPRTTGWYAQLNAQAASAGARGLDFTWQMQGTSYPVYALRTADGGALVLYGMLLSATTEHPHRALGDAIDIPAELKPLLPAGQIAYHEYVVNETWEFAAVDPPAAAQAGKLTVIAASGTPSYVHAF